MKTVLVAIGGNALFDVKNGNNIDPSKIGAVCQEIVEAVLLGYQPVITFGNGPQVGNLLEMAEKYTLPPKYPISLDTCVAWTQAEIGYFLAKEVYNQLYEKGHVLNIMAVNTTVVVDSQDPAFLDATKPVGNFYNKEDARTLSETYGWQMKADSNRGYRRVVPSPAPIRIVEEEAIKALVKGECLLFCGGGGGIPVIEEDGLLRGVEAVIDKDRTACLLAEQLKIQELVICTAVDHVCLHFGTPEEMALSKVTTKEARRYLEEGQFPPGSMGPKVESMVRFVEQGGERAIITRLESLGKALRGESGTQFVKES